MTAPVFVGDEVTGAGYRLAGARVVLADGTTVEDAIRDALDEAELILVGATAARDVPQAWLASLMRAGPPLVLVVPDIMARTAVPDLGAEAEHALGIAQ